MNFLLFIGSRKARKWIGVACVLENLLCSCKSIIVGRTITCLQKLSCLWKFDFTNDIINDAPIANALLVVFCVVFRMQYNQLRRNIFDFCQK